MSTSFPGSAATSAAQATTNAKLTGPTVGTVTSVNSGVASVALLAANANRKGATIVNTDANALKVLLSVGVASATNYSHEIATNADWPVPFGYTGAIFGIWSADGSGAAVITELT